MKQPEIRKLDDGVTVVDYGDHWFLVTPQNEVTTRIARNGKVTTHRTPPRAASMVLALLSAKGDPTADHPGRQTCKPDQSCCDFVRGN